MLELLRSTAESASPGILHTADKDLSNARYWLRNSEAGEPAFVYSYERLPRAAAFCAAHYQIPRQFAVRFMGDFFFEVLMVSGSLPTGWQQGRQLGLISFTCEAPKFDGAEFDGAPAPQQGWNVYPGASTQRLIKALKDVRSLPPDIHLFSREIGDWPFRMLGTQAAISLGWGTGYLPSFASRLLLEPEIPAI